MSNPTPQDQAAALPHPGDVQLAGAQHAYGRGPLDCDQGGFRLDPSWRVCLCLCVLSFSFFLFFFFFFSGGSGGGVFFVYSLFFGGRCFLFCCFWGGSCSWA